MEGRTAARAETLNSHLGTAPGFALTPERIEQFLTALLEQGRTPDTITTYRRNLTRLHLMLPEDDRVIREGTLAELRDRLLESGYSHSMINCCLAAADGLLDFYGRRDLQTGRRVKKDTGVQPELTRSEYLRLLSTARTLEKERAYLLVKVFGTMGLPLRALPRLTVEAVREGRLVFGASILHIPACLREELLDYAAREGIGAGPVFVTGSRIPINRRHAFKAIQDLSADARVAEEKCNPRCLKKLYQSTLAGISDNISLLVEQTYDRLLDTEQLTIGWRQGEIIGK